jgi:hypothetical protein
MQRSTIVIYFISSGTTMDSITGVVMEIDAANATAMEITVEHLGTPRTNYSSSIAVGCKQHLNIVLVRPSLLIINILYNMPFYTSIGNK